MRIAILGAGPSGMMAAHTVAQERHHITIYDRDPNQTRKRSGLFYLNTDCNLALERIEVPQRVLGVTGLKPEEAEELYAQKVYGDTVSQSVSIPHPRQREKIVFNGTQAINRLWDLYKDFIEVKQITGFEHVRQLVDDGLFDAVICTIPAPQMFPALNFPSQTLWAMKGLAPVGESFIFYSIVPQHKWYRCSALFGNFMMEYGAGQFPSIDISEDAEPRQLFQIQKVLQGDSVPVDAFPQEILLTGRYGEWDPNCLVEDVYYRTQLWLDKIS